MRVMLRRTRGQDRDKREHEAEKLGRGSADYGASAKDEHGSWIRARRLAVTEEGKRNPKSLMDRSGRREVGNSIRF